jgi:hypothetical protein
MRQDEGLGSWKSKNLDIFKEAGGADRALEKSFTGVTPNEQGYILLEFKPVLNYALIYAIEVTLSRRDDPRSSILDL